MDIAIVIPCFKRVNTLVDLCDSLLKADYCGDRVSLVFSIDYAEGSEVPSFADAFSWPYGNKTVIRHEKNIGLRNNILSCGDLTEKYDAVIILEDDLEVMPAFYQFAKAATVFYNGEDRIAGISIYHYFLEEMTWNMFIPIDEGYDCYFVKWASSWGQLWTRDQWRKFRQWYETHQDISSMEIPKRVKNWSGSWKKFYIAYLTDTNRYFVFPNKSFVYNGYKGNGTHSVASKIAITSSPLATGEYNCFRFAKLDDISYRYDAYFQLEPREIQIERMSYLVDFDLFGHKEVFHSPFVITSRKCKKEDIIYSFDAGMLPLELNILKCKKGEIFNLVKADVVDCASIVPFDSFLPIRKTMRNWKQLFPLAYESLVKDVKTSFNYKLNKIFNRAN
jgi:hypothetical protein